jgi:hypothetical protein
MDDLSDAAVETAEADVARVDAPDFATVLARAQGIRAEASEAVPVREDEVVLRPFVVAAIAEAEADVATMVLHGPPGEPHVRSGRWKWVVGIGAVAIAAAAALVVMLPNGWSPQRDTSGGEASQAVSAVEAAGADAEPFETKQPAPRPVERARPERPAIPEEEVVVEPAPPPAPKHASVDAKLRQLDALAAKQLGDGQVDAADRTLEQLIEIGGRRRLVELAFGDRFTIAHRRGDARRQVALWQAYLRRFPHGRLADDARAGICRHAPEKRRDACWREYLRDFPGGAYSDLARREAGPGAP